MSSSQLTKSYSSEEWLNHQPDSYIIHRLSIDELIISMGNLGQPPTKHIFLNLGLGARCFTGSLTWIAPHKTLLQLCVRAIPCVADLPLQDFNGHFRNRFIEGTYHIVDVSSIHAVTFAISCTGHRVTCISPDCQEHLSQCCGSKAHGAFWH